MVAAWDPTEQYDPLRPNDYNEYKVWKQKERIERRERLAEERRADDRKRYRRGSSHTDSDRSDSEDERPRKSGTLTLQVQPYIGQDADFFLFNSGRYEEHYDRWSRADDERTRGFGSTQPSAFDSAPVVINRDMSGEEAFQRRLAMSTGIRPVSPPMAPVNAPLPQVAEDDFITGLQGNRAHIPAAETGEEAYLRRVAMSQAAPSIPPPLPESEVEASSTLAYDPFAPRSVPPPPPGPPEASIPNALEEKIKAAAAIAARLGALAATASASAGPSSGSGSRAPSPSQVEEEEAVSSKK